MAERKTGFWRKKQWLWWVAGAVLTVAVALVGIGLVLARRAEPILRARIVQQLQEHFHARVELDSFHLTIAGELWVEGKGLRIWPPAQVEGVTVPGPGEPLIRLAEFRFHAPIQYKPGQPIHISVVQLKGLDVKLPPRTHFGHVTAGGVPAQKKTGIGLVRFEVDAMECVGAHLTLQTSKPGKLPLEFAIEHLNLTKVGGGGAMGFEAQLTNPRPVGIVHTEGSLGPWRMDDPGESAITGSYRFEHADLGGFKGIAGILNSTGRYQGTLRALVVDGDTDTPDFRLTHFGAALPLHTSFHARVDGTNGDTWLEPVEATLGHSHFTATGQIVRVMAAEAGQPQQSIGHDIALKVNVDRGRIEDFLRLASRSGTPVLTGALTLKAALDIPPGKAPVHQRLKITGSFSLDQAQFTSTKIQGRIAQLSLRGQGRPGDLKTDGEEDIRSTMAGNFQMEAGVITLPALEYTVPGAVIDLTGTYGLEGGVLHFTGTAKTQATVSQMVGGWKGMLLKSVDRYLKKDGAGMEVPIHIDGTREDPQFGIDFNRIKIKTGAPQ